MKTLQVVAAVIRNGNRIFATQRGYGPYKDKWEFPGGKIENDETPEEALKREVLEELDVKISVEKLIDTIEFDYPEFHLSMKCFWAEIQCGEPVLLEHEDAKWLTVEELNTVKWLPADISILGSIAKELNKDK